MKGKFANNGFGDLVRGLCFVDDDANGGLLIKRQTLLVACASGFFVGGQRTDDFILPDSPPAQLERRIQPDRQAEARHQFAVFLPRDGSAAGRNDGGLILRGPAKHFRFDLPEPCFAFAGDQFGNRTASLGHNQRVEINKTTVQPGCQSRADRRLAASHKADQKDRTLEIGKLHQEPIVFLLRAELDLPRQKPANESKELLMSSLISQEQLDAFTEAVKNLVTEDDEPVDNIFSAQQQRLLVQSLYSGWIPPAGEEPLEEPRKFMADANVGIFVSPYQPAIVPDVFISLDVERPEGWELNEVRAYYVWEFEKAPDVAIEIVSNRKGGEMDRKQKRYSRMGVDYYVVFDPFGVLEGDKLSVYEPGLAGHYRRRADYRLPNVGLSLTLWTGVFENTETTWLRWLDAKGNLIPTAYELAAIAESRAATALTLAKQAENRATQAEDRAAKAENENAQLREELERLRAQLKRD